MGEGDEGQQAETEQVATAVQEMSATINEVADSARLEMHQRADWASMNLNDMVDSLKIGLNVVAHSLV